MKIATAQLQSTSPYSHARHHQTDKKAKESAADYEERTWREKIHADEETGVCFIPPMALCKSALEAAKYLSIPISGKGKSTYTKHFEAGVRVNEANKVILPYKKEEVRGEWVFVPSDGMRGGTRRVMKCFPYFGKWQGTVEYQIHDDVITESVFREVLDLAGTLIGIGRFRPKNCGFYGMYECTDLQWREL